MLILLLLTRPARAKWRVSADSRRKMPSVSLIAMMLMPLSQAAAWYAVLVPSPRQPLFATVLQTSAFYCAWALWKNIVERQEDLGSVSMGCLAVASYLQHRWLSLAATALVLLNFLAPAYFVLWSSPRTLALMVKESDGSLAMTWAYIFKAYFVSSFSFGVWCFTSSGS